METTLDTVLNTCAFSEGYLMNDTLNFCKYFVIHDWHLAVYKKGKLAKIYSLSPTRILRNTFIQSVHRIMPTWIYLEWGV